MAETTIPILDVLWFSLVAGAAFAAFVAPLVALVLGATYVANRFTGDKHD